LNFEPGQTLIFIGDHTSPDDPGYVQIISGVLGRFRPELGLTLISAGAKGQTAAALQSKAMMDILTSSRPDWLVVGLGLTDALREPAAAELSRRREEQLRQRDEQVESTFGPEYRTRIFEAEPASDIGAQPALHLQRLPTFERSLREAVAELRQAGVRNVLLTLALPGMDHPVNPVLQAYSRAIRALAGELDVPLVDVERAFRNMYDRAANYKQRVVLTAPDGALNVQGQTLLARTFLDTLELLPGQK
jgi:lysophospholipase L1-like esterase